MSLSSHAASPRHALLVASLGAPAGPAGLAIAATVWLRATTADRRVTDAAALPPVDTAIVAGARVNRDGSPSNPLWERLEAARELYASGRVRRILVSGDAHAREYDEPQAMRRHLVHRGVPDADVLCDGAGHRTLATMRSAAALDLGRVVVCTQAFHLPRAVFLALSVGLDAWGLEVDQRLDPYAVDNAARELVARARALLDVATAGRRR